jgi:TRAP-type C4-dicarboxylate transport system substrate-binding protein
MKTPRIVKWLIAHQPQYLFVRTAKAFQLELDKLIPGEYLIDILTMESYIRRFGDIEEMKMRPPEIKGLEDVPVKGPFVRSETFIDSRKKWTSILNAIGQGKIELSQTQVTVIGNILDKNFRALDLPFLFKDHEHATAVLDGEIGNELLDELASTTDIRGLAFTYSGGYRVIGSQHKITNLNELSEASLITTTVPTRDFFTNLGVTSQDRNAVSSYDLEDIADNNGAIETTYLRFSGKSILKTDHSMFLTSILCGNLFWDTLPEEHKSAFITAAKKVAKLERKWSIDDAVKYEQDASDKGITIFETSDQEKEIMREIAKFNYTNVENTYTPGLVNRILNISRSYDNTQDSDGKTG